jgi:hypothetical protein
LSKIAGQNQSNTSRADAKALSLAEINYFEQQLLRKPNFNQSPVTRSTKVDPFGEISVPDLSAPNALASDSRVSASGFLRFRFRLQLRFASPRFVVTMPFLHFFLVLAKLLLQPVHHYIDGPHQVVRLIMGDKIVLVLR